MIKNQAGQTINFTFVSATDGNAVIDTGTPTGRVQIDAAAAAATAGTFTNRTAGQWSYAPTQAETNGDNINFQFNLTGAIVKDFTIYTRAAVESVNVVAWQGVPPAVLVNQRVQTEAQVVADKTGYSLSATQGFNNTGQTTVNPVNVTQWAGNANAPKVSATNELPRVDILSVTDNLQAATDLAANIANLDAAITTRSSHDAAAVVTAMMAELIETGFSFKAAIRIMASTLAGHATGLGTTTANYTNALANDKTRVTATVDADGNRSAVTLDLAD